MTEIETPEEEICICLIPVWMYDENDKEYYSLPVQTIRAQNIRIRPDLGDVEVTLKREGRDIKFIAMPFETLKERGIEVPQSEMVDHEVPLSDGTYITKPFMKLTWQKILNFCGLTGSNSIGSSTGSDSTGSDCYHIRKYDVKGHIVSAGCHLSETIKEKKFDEIEGKEKEVLRCANDKDIYVALHPIDEFLESHIEEIHMSDKKEIKME